MSFNFLDSAVLISLVRTCFHELRKMTLIYFIRSLHIRYGNCKFTAKYHILMQRYENMIGELYSKPKREVTVDYFFQSVISHG